MSKFWASILSSDSPTSSKRLITLIISMHFILASFVVLFIAFYVIFYTVKGKVDKDLLQMLQDVLEYDFYIILSGLGFITADNTVTLLTNRAQTKAAIINAMGKPPAIPTKLKVNPPTSPPDRKDLPSDDEEDEIKENTE